MANLEPKLAEVKVEFWSKNPHLSEIYQVTGFEYAFVSADFKQCHQWVRCRDFLNDALRSHVIGKKDGIYGFTFDPKVNIKLDMTKARMLIRRKVNSTDKDANVSTLEMMKAAIAGIHCVEKQGKIKPLSKLYKVSGEEEVYMFEGAPDWTESTFMISLYTLLIRLGAKRMVFKGKAEFDKKLEELCKKTTYEDHDISYLKSVREFIDKIVEKRKELKYGKEKEKEKYLFEARGISIFHNYTGVVALCNEAKRIRDNRKGNSGLEELTPLAACICQ